MRTKNFFLILILSLMALVSCKSDKKPDLKSEYIRPASMNYSKEDTMEINSLVASYVETFNKKDFLAASNMLFKVRNDSIFPLSEPERTDYINAYSHFPTYGCKVKSFLLRSDKNNEVKLLVQIISSGNLEKEEGVTCVSLNPVYINGKWYLTLLDKNAEGVNDVYATNQ